MLLVAEKSSGMLVVEPGSVAAPEVSSAPDTGLGNWFADIEDSVPVDTARGALADFASEAVAMTWKGLSTFGP